MAAPLLIADVPWLLYRAFFSLPKSIVDEQGQPVNALLGTVNALLSAIEARPSRAVVACMGAEQAVYRVKLYPPYHAHREEMPPALARQWSRAPELLESLDWTVSSSDELEADDVMFSHAMSEVGAGGDALLLSGDRDMFQMVGEHVKILELSRDRDPIEIGAAKVLERYGIPPELVTDFIALRGDPSDGLPGAPGIGAKTAAELLQRHGSLENVLAAAKEAEPPRVRRDETAMRPRTATALRENDELLRGFKQIATLVPIDDVGRPPDCPSNFAAGALKAREFGMKRLAERLEQMAAPERPT
jgi:5'-3' exonuclease